MAKTPAKSEKKQVARRADPFETLRSEVDRLFANFGRSGSAFGSRLFDLEPFKGIGSSLSVAAPKVNVAETDKALEVTAELPGMDEKDVEVSLADGVLTVKGEKKEEKEDKNKNYYLVERSYGSFQRSFRLPENVNEDKISAGVTKGVLKVTIPKKKTAKKASGARKIPIKSR
jgi:HSP20 family protein